MAKPRGAGSGNRQRAAADDDDDNDEGGGAIGALSDEARTEIGQLVNAAVSSQLQRKLPNAIKASLDEGLAPIMAKLNEGGGSRRRAADDDQEDPDDDLEEQPTKGKRGKGQRAAARDPETENMRKRLATLEEERKTEREQTRNRDRDTVLREQLTAAGVEPNRMRGAIAVLRESMKYDDKVGEWAYKAKRDGFEEDLDVETGVNEWAGTDEGKSYLAPPATTQQRGGSGTRVGTTGSGGRTGGVIGGGRPATDPKQAKAQGKADAVKSLNDAVGSLMGGTIPLGG